jgi:hypothetical protein
MLQSLLKSVRSFLAQKHAVQRRETRLIRDLNRILPQIGYRIVPASSGKAAAKRAIPGLKLLACPHCDRRFGQPLHLGRHLSATHRRGKAAA